MKLIFLIFVVMSVYASCLAHTDARMFEDLLAIWCDKLLWSPEAGFSVRISTANPPGLIYDEGHEDDWVATDNGILRLERGRRYILTNGRGRSQRLWFVDTETESTNSQVVGVFPRDVPVFCLEHLEVYERYGDEISRLFVVSANGEVYDFERKMKRNFPLPFVAPKRESFEEIRQRNFCGAAKANLGLVRQARDKALSWTMQHPGKLPVANGVTNEVCYNEFGNPNAESYRLVLKNPNLKPEFRVLVESLLRENHTDRDDWALVVRQDNGVRIVAVNEGLWSGLLRCSWFSESGKVEAIMQSHPFDEQSFYVYDGQENLQAYIAIAKGKAKGFWVRENGELVECKDEARVKKLIEEAIAHFKQFKRGAK